MRVPTYIARISRGKDSLKMLDVILTRDLPLDRITTSEVWATDTIPAWLPPVNEFNERVDEYIWKKYHIEVERLCARNQDGTKRTYEQGFYHIPKRRHEDKSFGKSGGDAVSQDSPFTVVRGVKVSSNGIRFTHIQVTIKGFPGTTGVNWCQKLKLVKDFPRSPTRRALTQISWSISALPPMNPSASYS